MGILNIGTQALLANQVALSTVGNNIANANTAGYSRQTAILQTVQGQYTGSGYVGKGVSVATIQRSYSAFLTNQATLASSTQSADQTRSDYLTQLTNIFQGGTSGLGQSISDMLNSFADVASAPTDLTARTVALTSVDETASRLRAASQSLDDLQSGVTQALSDKVSSINSLASNIASLNAQITKAQAAGQPPNDLLDQRDELIKQLNQYVQTSQVPADDGSISLFIGGSQAIVLGTTASPVSIVKDDFGDNTQSKLAITRNGVAVTMDDTALAGGEVPGLLRFQNTDLNTGRNLLGRITLALTTSMNDQHKLGLDLNGNPGGNLFSQITFSGQNIRQPVPPAQLNTGNATLGLAVDDVSKFVASDYQVTFTSATTGTITRKSDGVVTTFPQTPAPAAPILATVDGLNITMPSGTPAAGDRFLIKPFSTSASNISAAFSSPQQLAVASPVAGLMGTANTGSLQQVSVTARTNPPTNVPVTLSFTGASTYTRSDDVPANSVTYTYTPGQSIEGTVPATTPLSQWSVTLQGTPAAGDSFTVETNPYPSQNAGNATSMLNLRDKAMFDGAATTDGYAGMIAQLGVMSQSANYAATVSSSVATSLATQKSSVSGVNLDEEASKLLQYQQAYQASAKMISIAQNIFDTLIQGLTN